MYTLYSLHTNTTTGLGNDNYSIGCELSRALADEHDVVAVRFPRLCAHETPQNPGSGRKQKTRSEKYTEDDARREKQSEREKEKKRDAAERQLIYMG